MKTQLENTIIELWHASKTALSCQLTASRYDRMIYIKKSLIKYYPTLITGISNKHIWFIIEDCIN